MSLDRVLLVGGCGFLGLHLIDEFWKLEKRPEIHVLDVRPLPKVDGYAFDAAKIHVHVSDLTKKDEVVKVLKASKPSVVVHSASPVHGLGAEIYYKVNVLGTQVLLESCEEQKVPAMVYTSSAGVVFNGEDLFGVDEKFPMPAKAMDAYNLTKQQAEEHVLKHRGNLKVTALRPAGIFGPGDRQMIPSLRLMAQRGQHKIQLGDNLNLFDVTYVGNVAYAHVLAAEHLLKGTSGVANEAFFITNDSPIYFWSLAKQIWKHDGYTVGKQWVIPKDLGVILGHLSSIFSYIMGKEPTFTAFRVKTACATRYYDISKAKQVLGYQPKWSLEDAIRETLERSEKPKLDE